MRIALGADHAGFALKQELRHKLAALGHDVTDFGTMSADSTDYPDYAGRVAHAVAEGTADRGVLVCFTGVGMSIAANKVHGIRAALGVSTDEVQLTRAHNDANVLTLGARYVDVTSAMNLIQVFLDTQFEGGRHARRVAKIAELEQSGAGQAAG